MRSIKRMLFVMGALLVVQASPLKAAAVRTIPGITANTLAANDDGSTGPVNIGFAVNFFGVKQNFLYVNNNGNVTFASPLAAFTPTGISTTVAQAMIAPFFADVDTRGVGSGLVQYGTGTFCGRNVFGVNWINVGYFFSHVDKLNSFQLLLIDRSDTGAGNFDIEMNYDGIQWETGDASGGTNGVGGTSVEAGYTNGLAGAARVSFQFPGSQVNGAMIDGGPKALISNSIGSTTPGRYHFFVRAGVVTPITNVTVPTFFDISSSTKVYFPLRYTYHRNTDLYSGLVTLYRSGKGVSVTAPATSSTTEGCLDESATTTVTPPTPIQTAAPITVVVRRLPPGVTLGNPSTGVTTKGLQYLSFPAGSLNQGQFMRVGMDFRNPLLLWLNTYFVAGDFSFQIIAGPFDPTKF